LVYGIYGYDERRIGSFVRKHITRNAGLCRWDTRRLLSALSSSNSERFVALEKLYQAALYTGLLFGGFAVLFYQFLSSNLLYVRKYAMAKLYPLMNESFKLLYGFVNEKSGQVKLSHSSYWNKILELNPLMNEQEKVLFKQLEDVLLKNASFSWWKKERDAEVHLDAEKIYKHRCAQDNENVAIRDALSFYDILSRTTALTTIMLSRLSGVRTPLSIVYSITEYPRLLTQSWVHP